MGLQNVREKETMVPYEHIQTLSAREVSTLLLYEDMAVLYTIDLFCSDPFQMII